jgi:hypothetical protein
MKSERPITTSEVAVIRWLLANAPRTDIPFNLNQSITALRIIGGCACGCSSVEFLARDSTRVPVADALVQWPDGSKAGVILWAQAGGLAGLEVYDMDPGASHRPITAESLRTYEEEGAALGGG